MASEPCIIYQHLKIFLRCFFLVGLSPISTFPSANTFCLYIPAILSACTCSVLTGLGIYYRYVYKMIDVKELGLVSNAHFTLELLTTLLILSQRFLHTKAIKRAINKLALSSNFLRKKFNQPIEIDSYFLRINCMFFALFYSFVPALASCFAPRSFKEFRSSHTLEFIFTITQAPHLICALHIVVYIDWIRLYMKELNEVLLRRQTCNFCQRRSMGQARNEPWTIHFRCHICIYKQFDTIKNAKLLYSQAWQISRCVNEYFGLSFIAILLRSFSECSVQLYGIYGIFSKKEKNMFATGPILRFLVAFLPTAYLVNSGQYLMDEVRSNFLISFR